MTKSMRAMLGSALRTAAMALGLWALTSVVFDQEALRTIVVASQAVGATVVLASLAQWAYTSISFTDQVCRPGEEAIDEIIVSSRIRALGAIYCGTALLVGLVFFAAYRGSL